MDLAEDTTIAVLGLSEPQSLLLRVGLNALCQLLRHPNSDDAYLVDVISSVPGRMRLRIGITKGDLGVADGVDERLRALPGVIAVNTSATTGTTLIKYITNSTEMYQMIRAAEHAVVCLRRGALQQPPGLFSVRDEAA